MLVGEPPYTGSTPQAILGRILTGEAEAVSAQRKVPPNVDAAIRKTLEKVPADRFGSARDMVRALGDPAFRWDEAVADDASAVARWRRLAPGSDSRR